MRRWHQILLIGSVVVGCWLGMQAVHELGHVLGAWITGGKVTRVVLHPLSFSRTDVGFNPHPLIVAWMGPVVGVLLPLAIWAGVGLAKVRWAFVLRFFAGFCLLANGLYIGLGSLDRVGDCDQLLQHGASAWQLWLFGLATAPAGLGLWHRQGTHFDLGVQGRPVEPGVAYGCLIACAALIALGLMTAGA